MSATQPTAVREFDATRKRPMPPAVFYVAILLSAFLLFQVELILGKFMLPWFGGASAVWATSLVFFQLVLLAGYAYSHWITTSVGESRQAVLHSFFLVLSVCVMALLASKWRTPITPGAAWQPAGNANPILNVVKLLLVTIGVPFLLLSTTGPLLQRWYADLHGEARVYRLYAVSNAGSLLGLITYPLLIEPRLRVTTQAWVWCASYFCFVALVVLCGTHRRLRERETHEEPAVGDRHARWSWMLLPACSSMLLLGTTNVLCSEVAVVPLLWVVPLVLYLLSWIVCFQNDRWYKRSLAFPFLLGTGFMAALALSAPRVSLLMQSACLCLAQFAASMVCHGELARKRPAARDLTLYYLLIATGSAAGGLFVLLVAPLVFRGYWEFQIALLSTLVLVIAVTARSRLELRASTFFAAAAAFMALLLALSAANIIQLHLPAAAWLLPVVIAALAVLRARRGRSKLVPRWVLLGASGAAVAFVFAMTLLQVGAETRTVVGIRDFYGVMRVTEHAPLDAQQHWLALIHGHTVHGQQFQAAALRSIPTTYFAHGTGVGQLMLALNKQPEPLRVGIVGMGAGTLAAYGRPGDEYRFYELDPAVIRLAHSPDARFTFIRDSRATVTSVAGDARLTLQQEANAGGAPLDVLVLDAFSGDAIPVHLLTVDAFLVYLRRIKSSGVIAVHISNRHAELESPLAEVALALGLQSVRIDNDHGRNEQFPAQWILLSSDHQRMRALGLPDWPTITNSRHVRLWTDDFSNLLQVLR